MAAESPAPSPAECDQRRAWVYWLLGAAMLVATVAILHAGRGTLAWYDEWSFIIDRRGHSLDTLLRDHNGHLVVAPLLLYKVLLQIAGLTDYWVFRAALAGLHLAVALGVFVLARRRVGEVAALVATVLVLFCFAGADDLIWAFQISFVMAVAFGVWALVALERNSVRGDLLACLCLIGALATSGVGAPFVLGALVIVACDDRRLRRAWVVVVPLLLFAIWHLKYHPANQLSFHELPTVPRFVSELASNAVGGLAGLGIDYGRPLALALAGAVILRFAVPRRVTPWLLAMVVVALGLWGLIALDRSWIDMSALVPRYIYPGAVLVVLIVVELLRGRRLAPRSAAIALAVVCVAGLANYGVLRGMGGGLRSNAEVLQARLGALSLVADSVAPGFQPAPREDPQITARGALEAQIDFGRIALTRDQLVVASVAQRAAADAVLLSVPQVTVEPIAGVSGGAPNLLAVSGARALLVAGCQRIIPTDPGSTVDIALPAGSSIELLSSASVPLYLRRFGDSYGETPNLVVGAGQATLLSAKRDEGGVAWTVEAKPSAPLTICAR